MNSSILNKKKITGKLKAVLVVPNFRWGDWDINTLWHYIPYNLCILAAMVEDVCDVTILDANKKDMSENDFASLIRQLDPDLVGITVLMDQYSETAHKAASLVKSVKKNIPVIMGGVYVTVNPEIAMKDPNIDLIVIGEGEYVFKDLIAYFMDKGQLPQKGICYREDGKVINKGRSDFVKDLDAIPMPAYHLIEFEKYAMCAHRKSVDSPPEYPYAHIMTSRGCPFGCTFCQVEHISGSLFRPRSPKNILDEIQHLKDRYGIKSILFDDDNLFTDKERARAIFRGMIEKEFNMPWASLGTAVFKLDEDLIKLMKASGCTYVDLAIESGVKRVLKEIIKKPVNLEYALEMIRLIKREGIYIAANFVVGFPTEKWSEIRETVKFAEDINADYVKLFVAIPLRNTKLWDLCIEYDAFKKDFKGKDIRWSQGQIETKEFSSNDLTVLRAYEWDRINFTSKEKRARTAAIMGITEEELYEIRKNTLNNACKQIK